MQRRGLLFAHVFACSLLAAHLAQTEASPAVESPVIMAVIVQEPPALDGVLDDPCWEAAVAVSDFYDVYQEQPAAEKTIAYLCYDAENIYVAIRCFDTHPEQIRAFQRKRGGDVLGDDCVLFGVDTYGSGKHTYWFRANSLGTQHETIPGGSAPKIEWRGDWSCAAKRVDDGWNCEMAIPFAMLRYTVDTDTFLVGFGRGFPRQQTGFSWPDLGINWDLRLGARWIGLNLPRVDSRPLSMFYLQTEADEEATGANQGLDVKHQPLPGLTALLTLNPDFRNVEQEVEGIDFTYTQRFVDDARPFFMEGRDPSSLIWYTRAIPEVDLGAKVYGTLGETNFDCTHVRDFGSRDDSSLNWFRYFNNGYSQVGASLVNRHEPGVVSNTVGRAKLSLGRRIGKEGRQEVKFWSAKSKTYGDGGDGSVWQVSASHVPDQRHISTWISYEDVGADFNPADGFLPLLDRDVRSLSTGLGFSDRIDRHRIREWNWSAGWNRQERHDGTLYTTDGSVSLRLNMQDNSSYRVGWESGERPPHKDRLLNVRAGWNEDELYRRGRISVVTGRQASGHYTYADLSQGLYLSSAASLQLGITTSRLRYPDRIENASLIIATYNQDLTPYTNVSARLVSRAGKHNLYAAYRQSLRRGMDLYLILGDPNAEQSRARLALKALWVL